MPKVYPELKSSPVIKRHPNNPILSRKDIPYESTQIYNAGVTKYQGKYVMVFRNDVRTAYGELQCKRIELGIAYSDDGIVWKAEDKPFFTASMLNNDEIKHIYDPRLTVIDGQLHMCFAVDTKHGVCGGVGIIHNMERLEIKSLSTPDNRNMVLFPEKINGNYVRLERPMPVYSRGGDKFDIWLSESPDLVYWGKSRLVLATEDVPYCNDKIGPGAPPIKTDRGWLIIFHSVDIDPNRGKNGWEKAWRKRYVIGLALLDPEDPSRVIGMSKRPLMVPEGYWELEEGYRTNALFPCGMLEENGLVRIYYSAGDAIVRMATAKLEDLLDLCTEPRK